MASGIAILLWLIVATFLVLGILGTVVPALPGTPLIFAGIFLAAWMNDFQKIGAGPIVTAAVLTVVSLALDFIATSLGAKRFGASRLAVIGAAVGTLVGVFFLLPGIILGPFIGAVVGEFIARRSVIQAGRAGIGTWLGLLLGTIAKLVIAFAMVGLLLLALIF